MKSFRGDFPAARAFLVYGGRERRAFGDVDVWPLESLLMNLPEVLNHNG